jgi:hypothetical protein
MNGTRRDTISRALKRKGSAPAATVRMGSMTMARKGSWNCWFSICVEQSIPDIQQPYPG